MNRFECDKDKARANHVKHGVRFTDAGKAIKSAPTLTGRSPQSDDLGEERNLSITTLADGRAVVVVWTPRNGNVRIISVRHARKNEREALNAYLQNLQ
ncbi:BrnT family toxin [Methyloversatilis thermotolerans]|uniref:BrnT family toxin n=1 Tax=Methyloversatilis thermotolerans TaxID=1346290 RepID=UPI0003752C95|nr:BrnT family toxin [Methyloversatilis thermotolerans]